MNEAVLRKNTEALKDAAREILEKLNLPRRKNETPVAPLIVEFFGLHKSGKDTQLVEVDRWFRRQGYRALVRQESAETEVIRSMPRANPYIYEMRHFAYAFANLLDATAARDFHLVALNRGVIDTLCWLEKHVRQGAITEKQRQSAKAFILNGPWLEAIDGLFCLTCDVKTALEREYGMSDDVVYGSRMNPKELELMLACLECVCAELKATHPTLPIFKIDTANRAVSEVRDEIISLLIASAAQRLKKQ